MNLLCVFAISVDNLRGKINGMNEIFIQLVVAGPTLLVVKYMSTLDRHEN